MIVIRIEKNSNGGGIFQECRDSFYRLDRRHSSMRSAKHIEGFTKNHYCAYKSLCGGIWAFAYVLLAVGFITKLK